MSDDIYTMEKAARNWLAGQQIGVNRFGDMEPYQADAWGDATGFVYFITIGEPYPTHVKVGYTRKNPFGRMRDLQTGCPFKMAMLGFAFGNQQMESELHDVFSHYRKEGEWFEFSDYISNNIDLILSAEY